LFSWRGRKRPRRKHQRQPTSPRKPARRRAAPHKRARTANRTATSAHQTQPSEKTSTEARRASDPARRGALSRGRQLALSLIAYRHPRGLGFRDALDRRPTPLMTAGLAGSESAAPGGPLALGPMRWPRSQDIIGSLCWLRRCTSGRCLDGALSARACVGSAAVHSERGESAPALAPWWQLRMAVRRAPRARAG
jgi:hypothetical protein